MKTGTAARAQLRRGSVAVALVLLLANARTASALEPGLRLHDYEHASWPSIARAAEVNAVALAPEGGLWLGTSEGLVRFDGGRMNVFESATAREGGIRRMLAASDGSLLVGLPGRGLSRLRGKDLTALGEREGVPAGRVVSLAETVDGTLWIAAGTGVARLPRGAARALPAAEGLAGAGVRVLSADPDGGLWAGVSGGLARWDAPAGSWRREPSDLPAAANVDVLWADRDGTLWVGTAEHGLWERRDGRWRAHQASEGVGARVRALLRDRGGHLWVATSAGLVSQDASGRFQPFSLPPNMCGDRISALAEDAEGGLWLGTQTCGLHRLRGRSFRTLTEEEGLPSNAVLGMRLTAGHTVWLSTVGHGVAHWPLERFAPRMVSCAAELPCRECWDFSANEAPAESLWAVCRKNTVLRWDGAALRRVTPLPAGLPAASFVLVARDGAVWLAHDEGVFRSQGGAAEPVRGHEPLKGHRIFQEGADGTIWIIGRNGAGAWRRGEVHLSMLPTTERPAEPWNALEDSEGALWIGTKGEGLRRVKNGRVATVGVAQGLPSGLVVQPLEDDRGRLWASSGKGIFWVKRRDLDAVADGTQAAVEAHLYDASDGIQMGYVGAFGHPAGFKDPGGRLWFGTHGGVAIFDPAALRAQVIRPVIEEVRVGGQPVGGTMRSLALRAPADVEATFAATTYGSLDAISFRHRLLGHDADWVQAGPGRSAHYARLEPGSYQLVVEARDREGEWGGPVAQLAFTLRPPFYRSFWFVLLCAGGAGLALLLVHRLRIAQTRAELHAVMGERTRIARDIHDTLAQAFVATSVQLECLEEGLGPDAPAKVRRHLDTARQVVEESLDEARRAVWVLRPQAVELGLAAALQMLVDRLSGTPLVALEVVGSRPLPQPVATELLRIAQEALSNARRHARARRIDVRLEFLPRSVTLTITDDGAGLDGGGHHGSGQGLIGMKERAAAIGAVLSIESAPAGGTRVKVELAE